MPVNDIRVMGRATQGVRVIRLDDSDEIADVTVVPHEEEEEGVLPENGTEKAGDE
jgi:DNA gyrase subunit A